MPDESTGEPRRRLVHPARIRGVATLFALSYVFYLAIGGFTGGLDFLTGAISAAVVAASLATVAFREEPTIRRTGLRAVRTILFLPVLLWEILKANLAIARILLHPGLPIEPVTETIETATSEGVERMLLANSLTLTPGTLVVDVQDEKFLIHALTAEGLADLGGGRLEQAVSWVFHGGDEQ